MTKITAIPEMDIYRATDSQLAYYEPIARANAQHSSTLFESQHWTTVADTLKREMGMRGMMVIA